MYVYIYIYIHIDMHILRWEIFGGLRAHLTSRMRTNGVDTTGATAEVMILTDWGKRYALALLGRYK